MHKKPRKEKSVRISKNRNVGTEEMKQTISKDLTEDSTFTCGGDGDGGQHELFPSLSSSSSSSTVVSIKDDYIENSMTDNQRYFLVSAIEYGSIRGLSTDNVVSWILSITTKDGKEEYDGEIKDIRKSLHRLCYAWDILLDRPYIIVNDENNKNNDNILETIDGGGSSDGIEVSNNNNNDSSNTTDVASRLSDTRVRQDLIKKLMDRAIQLKISDGCLIGPRSDILRLIIDTLLVLPEHPITDAAMNADNNSSNYKIGNTSIALEQHSVTTSGKTVGGGSSNHNDYDNISTCTGITSTSSGSGSNANHRDLKTTSSSGSGSSGSTSASKWDIFHDGLTSNEQKYVLLYWKQKEKTLDIDDMVRVIICTYLKTTSPDYATMTKFKKNATKTIKRVAIRHGITLA